MPSHIIQTIAGGIPSSLSIGSGLVAEDGGLRATPLPGPKTLRAEQCQRLTLSTGVWTTITEMSGAGVATKLWFASERRTTSAVPASSSSDGSLNSVAIDGSYIYRHDGTQWLWASLTFSTF